MKFLVVKIILCGVISHALLYSGNMSAEELNGIFFVKKSKVLCVTKEGKVFIEKDKMNCFDSFDIAKELRTDCKGKTYAVNVIHENDRHIQFRKETALHDDGHLELTVKIKVFPSTENTDPESLSYSFQIPSQILNGMRFRAICGKSYNWQQVEGKFGSENGKVLQCRYIVFSDGQKSFTFDFNPQGPFSGRSYPAYGEPVGYWDITEENQFINFTFRSELKYYGGIFTGKVCIFNEAREFAQDHAQRSFHYSENNMETSFSRHFSFGTPVNVKMFEKADCLKYSPEKEWGWAKAQTLEIVKSDEDAITGNCVSSPNGASDEFIVDIPSGIYVLTLQCGHNTLKTGPFNISINGKNAAGNIEIPAGETKTIDFTEYLKAPEKQIRIGFSGKSTWAVRSIIAQAVIFQNEDFSVNRKLWVIDKLFSPDMEYKTGNN